MKKNKSNRPGKISYGVAHIKVLFVILLIIPSLKGNGPRFNEHGKFKIVQFTDIHWDQQSEKCKETIKTMKMVLDEEKPDFSVITGDIVTSNPPRPGWLALAKVFQEKEIPWTVTLGNHDAEPDISREEIFALLDTLPYFMGEKGEVSGAGNFCLNIQSSRSEKPAAVLYFIDSQDYTGDPELGHYDWVRFDQIAWYRKISEGNTEMNGGNPLPALAFFHIPLLEYNHVAGKAETVGEEFEGIASPEINSGLFASFVEKKDVMGVFVGHDHDNNTIGIYKNIALAFGQVTGADAYGRFDRGGRVIVLKESDFAFESWIRNHKGKSYLFHYPSGLPETNENTEFLPSVEVKGLKKGLSYRYFEGTFKNTADMEEHTPVKKGVIDSVTLNVADVKDHFAVEFSGWLKIPHDGYYRFYTYSDDGSKLLINDKVVVDNDGSHSALRKNGVVALKKGYHPIKVLYFEDYMGNELKVGFSSIKIRETQLPKDYLFTR